MPWSRAAYLWDDRGFKDLEDRIHVLEQRRRDSRSRAALSPSSACAQPNRQALAETPRFRNLKREGPSARSVVRRHMSDFWSNFSLPGYKYVGESGRGRSDKYVWVFVLFISICISSKYIRDAYKKWQGSPVLLSFNDSLTPISLIPFPAVTICPPRRIGNEGDLEKTLKSCRGKEHCSEKNTNLLSASRLLCPKSTSLNESVNINGKYYRSSLEADIEKVAITCEDVIEWFKFGNSTYFEVFKDHSLCHQYFQTLYSDGGSVCFSFNMLPAKDMFRDLVIPPVVDKTTLSTKLKWSPDSMLKSADMQPTIPRYVDNNGRWTGLYVGMINFTGNEDGVCGEVKSNIKIFIHNPAEIPMHQTSESMELPTHKELFTLLYPNLVIGSEELDDYTPTNRRCYFSHERPLSLFKIYTQRNCQLECRVNCSLSLCDCVPFYLPRMNSSVKVCGKEHDKSCNPYLVTGILEGRYTWRNIIREFRNHTGNRIQRLFDGYEGKWQRGKRLTEELLNTTYPNCACDCPAACTSLRYKIVIEEGEPLPAEQLSREYTIVAISFKELEFTSVLRKELIGLSDFIANSGGVLGVFTGFSFLAVCELVYFLTIRLWSTIKHAWDDEGCADGQRLTARQSAKII